MLSTEAIDNAVLDAYVHGFYGYGNYGAKYWFVGMEEGGRELRRKLSCWHHRECRELEDLVDFHACIGQTRFFTEPARLQTTWRMLIRLLLSAEGQELSVARVRQYQQQRLARTRGNSCLLELLPLPSPTSNDFIHGHVLTQPHYANRETYRTHVSPKRAAHIVQRIREYHPQAVIFYSIDKWYQAWWKHIAGVHFDTLHIERKPLYIGQDSHTVFAITP
jgi:hypothetical protein